MGGSFQFTSQRKDLDCNGNPYYYTVTPLSNWNSANPSVCTMNNSTQKGLATGVAPGSGTITASLFGIVRWWDGFVCHYESVQLEGPGTCNVPDATISSAKSVTDGSSANFSVSTTGGSATAYAWSFTSPSGAGNSPNVSFSPNNQQSTTATGKWFALPNNACAASPSAAYTIKCTVSFPQGIQKLVQTTLTINLLATAGFVAAPFIYGYPAYSYDSTTQLWKVTGRGSLDRSAPSKQVYYGTSSQFYNKVNAHENKHVAQWNTGGMNADLYLVSSLMSELSPLTAPTLDVLKAKITSTWNAWNTAQQAIHQSRHGALEAEAFVVSDPIAPQYMYQGSCGQTL